MPIKSEVIVLQDVLRKNIYSHNIAAGHVVLIQKMKTCFLEAKCIL
jgi:hypothetical protein